jgi:hypothetical protein
VILGTLESWSGSDAQGGVEEGSGALYRWLMAVCTGRRR